MVIILVALTFLAAILAQAAFTHIARRREASRAPLRRGYMTLSPALAIPAPGKVPQFPADIYYHSGHAWARIGEDHTVRIGLDDFTQEIMGDIDAIEIPRPGGKLNQGEVAWRLRRGKRKLNQLAPLGGTVVEVNERLSKDPTLANRSPYEKGWILKIQPKALKEEMPELMNCFQFKGHFDEVKAKLMSSFGNQTLGTVYGDGEEVMKGVADKLDERSWRELVTQVFHSFPD